MSLKMMRVDLKIRLSVRALMGRDFCWRRAYLAIFLFILVAASQGVAQRDVEANLSLIDLPPGFSIEVYARVPEARSLAVGNVLNTVFVGTRRDTVYAVLDRDQDGLVESVAPFARGLDTPNGVAISEDGWLYVAENTRIIGFRQPEFDPLGPNDPVPVYQTLPAYGTHGWRYLALGPDDMLYVALGAPCNICELEDPMGTISRLNRDGSGFEVYASGIRNSVGMDFHPQTGTLYFTNNGADRLGDDVPADTLLRAPEPGLFFGFPFVASSGDSTPSPAFAGRDMPQEMTPAVAKIQAHSAPLGMHFYRGEQFPEEYRNVAFVAEHGSWNRSEPVGYQVSLFAFDEKGELLRQEVFATGWLQRGRPWGRPVDIDELSDGSLLVSDDFAGVIYRIRYREP
jgi:glucose/arabinose dehydrogenase